MGLGRRPALLGEIVGLTPVITYGAPRAGDIRHPRADIAAIRAALGYAPRWTTRVGLEALVAALRAEHRGG